MGAHLCIGGFFAQAWYGSDTVKLEGELRVWAGSESEFLWAYQVVIRASHLLGR